MDVMWQSENETNLPPMASSPRWNVIGSAALEQFAGFGCA
jgi:hypothetical protein